jgi:hypothetical protein
VHALLVALGHLGVGREVDLGVGHEVDLAGVDGHVVFLFSSSSASFSNGSWMVTSFVPSGNVASTQTLSIISGTPSMTSPRVSTWRPDSMIESTVAPARASSYTYAVNSAITSG